MTSSSERPDLAAIAHEAEAEILTAATIEGAVTADDDVIALSAAELGYYVAELGNLRDAAARLDEAEHMTG